MAPIGPKGPDPLDLLRRVLTPRTTKPVREFRQEGLLAGDAPLYPQEVQASGGSTASRTQEKLEIHGVFESESQKYWDATFGGYRYSNMAGSVDPYTGAVVPGEPVLPGVSSTDTSPAPISLMPTSSIYPKRPRTVAAGYDGLRNTLTVVFRDGTMYNYYEVSNLEWGNFRRAHSKGQFILSTLDGKRRGIADVGGTGTATPAGPTKYVEALYRIARTAQIRAGGIQRKEHSGPRSNERRRKAWWSSAYAGRYAPPSYVGKSKPPWLR